MESLFQGLMLDYKDDKMINKRFMGSWMNLLLFSGVFFNLGGDIDHEHLDESCESTDNFLDPENFPFSSQVVFPLLQVALDSCKQIGDLNDQTFQEDKLIAF